MIEKSVKKRGEIQNQAALQDLYEDDYIEVLGASVHNLQQIDVKFPRNKLIVITGVSGSGKSSLAFDTINAEGQRRYRESFSTYARTMLGNLDRPEVDKINGLSPVIAIKQKTTNHNPRATVGTTTEIYDFMRLLFARTATAYSYLSGDKMEQQSEEQLYKHLFKQFQGQTITLLAPIVKGKKGDYWAQLQQINNLGFDKVKIDGVIQPILPNMQLIRHKKHDIAIVIDHIFIDSQEDQRIQSSLHTALHYGKGTALVQDHTGTTHYYSKLLMDPTTGLSYDQPEPNAFSFNTPYGACPTCNGLGVISQIDIAAIIPDRTLSISRGGILPLGPYKETTLFKKITALLESHNLAITTPIQDFPQGVLTAILYGTTTSFIIEKARQPSPPTRNLPFEGVIPILTKQQALLINKNGNTYEPFDHLVICAGCQGTRLKKEACYFKLGGKNIVELATMNLQQLYDWFDTLLPQLNDRQQRIGKELIQEIQKRIRFLLNIGLYYLHLNRPLATLSGGESQRIRLAAQIGTQLIGILYILDEPSIGLHQRDNSRLIEALKVLRDLGNTVLVVEHDKEIILAADYLIEIGPGAGVHGGEVIAAGPLKDFLKVRSVTRDFLVGEHKLAIPLIRRKGNGQELVITGCNGNNLRNVTLTIPLGKMVCITGVSGSGKSTLIHKTLSPIVKRSLYKSYTTPLPYKKVMGIEHINKIVEISQAPIGRTPRSNPSTYTGIFSEIRNVFASLPEAKIRGYKGGRFSFNVKEGRCATCEGGGIQRIEMDFLPDVYLLCEVCKGKRYNRATLEIQYKGKSIADVLDMTVSKACCFFKKYPSILNKLNTLMKVGLGYITLGQHATTLSGGEGQRIKLATELSKKGTGNTIYILDEPTTGLHFQDIEHLLTVMQNLVDQGNTLIVIEHNMDVIKLADHVIDVGAEGGDQGGNIIVTGTPEEIAQHPTSYTGQFLKEAISS